MKNLFLFLLTFMTFSVGANAQTCIPDLIQLPDEVKTIIKLPINLPGGVKARKSSTPTKDQQATINYFKDLQSSLSSGRTLTKAERVAVNNMVNGKKTRLQSWIETTANSAKSLEEFHSAVQQKVSKSSNQQEIDILILVDYTVQVIAADYNARQAGMRTTEPAPCSGFWNCWGPCITGVTGGALGGGLAAGLGAAALSGPGAVISTPVASTIGAIAGGLSGAGDCF